MSTTGSVPADLDHIVFAGPNLAEAIAGVERLTGVRAAPGGQHPTGTENALIAFTVAGARGPHYLEVIGPQEGVAPSEVSTFGIDRRTEPGVATFSVHPPGIGVLAESARAAGVNLGEVRDLSRRKPDGTLLEWTLTGGPDRDPDPTVPFLIDWGSTPQPGLSDIPTVELLGLRIEHPDPSRISGVLELLGVATTVVVGEAPAIVATVAGPDGPVELR